MSSRIVRVSLLPLLLASTACVSASVVPLGQRTFEPVPREDVAVYEAMSDLPEDATYEKVALIRAEANDDWDDREDLVNKMIEEAAKLGANAIVLRGFEVPSTGERIAEAFLGVEGEVSGEGLAVRLTPAGRDTGAGTEEDAGSDGGDLPVVRVRNNP